ESDASGSSNDDCTAAPGQPGAPAAWLLGLGLLVALRRRRRA
ncbi:MAG: MYXO-CTERM sorting domain-containing protein, partial [Myxococcales bacterium]|nr:MYXO-CTERM sorting domain-containing protein [Myxococcales bacterium]